MPLVFHACNLSAVIYKNTLQVDFMGCLQVRGCRAMSLIYATYVLAFFPVDLVGLVLGADQICVVGCRSLQLEEPFQLTGLLLTK